MTHYFKKRKDRSVPRITITPSLSSAKQSGSNVSPDNKEIEKCGASCREKAHRHSVDGSLCFSTKIEPEENKKQKAKWQLYVPFYKTSHRGSLDSSTTKIWHKGSLGKRLRKLSSSTSGARYLGSPNLEVSPTDSSSKQSLDSDLPDPMSSDSADPRQRSYSGDDSRRHSIPTDTVTHRSEIVGSLFSHGSKKQGERSKDTIDLDANKASNSSGSKKFINPLKNLVDFGRPRSRSDAGQSLPVDKSSPLFVATNAGRAEQSTALTVIYQGQQLETSPPISPSFPFNLPNNSTSKGYKKRSKSPNGLFNRFRHKSGQHSPSSSPTSPTAAIVAMKSSTPREMDTRTVMPDPSKLPKECPSSSLEFTQDALKSQNVQRLRKMSYPFSNVNPIELVLNHDERNMSQSEELLLSNDPLDRIMTPGPPPGTELNTALTAKNFGVKRVSENKRFILFSKSPMRMPDEYLEEGCDHLDSTDAYSTFFQHSSCYDLIPDSAKLVVLASTLQVGRAFRALLYNGVRAAPIWSDEYQSFVGMLTISDFIKILNHYIKNNRDIDDDFENQTINSWREVTHNSKRDFRYLSPEHSLFSAVRCLRRYRVHRLPVIDLRTGNALYIITHKRLLKYLYMRRHELPTPSIFNETLESIPDVGTFSEVITIQPDQTLKQILPLFGQYRVSALPVVANDGSQRLIGIFAKFDTINLASTGNYKNLNMTVTEALSYKKTGLQHTGVVRTCLKTDTLKSIIDKIVSTEVHRLVVIDSVETNRVIGIVSLSDLLNFFILKVSKNGRMDDGMSESSSRSTINSNTFPAQPAADLSANRSGKFQPIKSSHSLPENSSQILSSTTTTTPSKSQEEEEEELFKMDVA